MNAANNEHITVGLLIAPHGINGAISADCLSDNPLRFHAGAVFTLDRPAQGRTELMLESASTHKGRLLLKFAGIDDRNAAETMRGRSLLVAQADIPPQAVSYATEKKAQPAPVSQPAFPPVDAEIQQTQAPAVGQQFNQTPIRILGVAFNTYILMEYGDLLILSDQHAVHERLLYEKFMKETAAAPASQAMLIPMVIHLSRGEYACYEENEEALLKAGFDLSPFGDDTVQLRGVPIILGQPQAEKCLLDALDELMENPSSTPADRTSRIIQMACKHAVKGGERLPEESVKQLIRDVIDQKVTPTCPHGRPLMVQITRTELEKRFRRIQN